MHSIHILVVCLKIHNIIFKQLKLLTYCMLIDYIPILLSSAVVIYKIFKGNLNATVFKLYIIERFAPWIKYRVSTPLVHVMSYKLLKTNNVIAHCIKKWWNNKMIKYYRILVVFIKTSTIEEKKMLISPMNENYIKR